MDDIVTSSCMKIYMAIIALLIDKSTSCRILIEAAKTVKLWIMNEEIRSLIMPKNIVALVCKMVRFENITCMDQCMDQCVKSNIDDMDTKISDNDSGECKPNEYLLQVLFDCVLYLFRIGKQNEQHKQKQSTKEKEQWELHEGTNAAFVHSPMYKDFLIRLQRPFMLGLTAKSDVYRKQFTQMFHESVSLDLLTRFQYIFAVQNWEHLGNTYWIIQALDLLLASFDVTSRATDEKEKNEQRKRRIKMKRKRRTRRTRRRRMIF